MGYSIFGEDTFNHCFKFWFYG